MGKILAIFDLHVQHTSILSIKFQVNWPFHSGEAENRFSKWHHLGLLIGIILASFDLQVTLILHIKF